MGDPCNSMIRVFAWDGRLQGSFGEAANRIDECNGPLGLWMDSVNHLYVADSARVAVFRVKAGHGATTSAQKQNQGASP